MNIEIIGSGFSGLALARSLNESGAQVSVYNSGSPNAASLVPAALLTPLTARQLRLTPYAEQCMNAARNWILNTAKSAPFPLHEGLVRPAFTQKYQEFYRRSHAANQWPEGWIRWLEPPDFLPFSEHLQPSFGGFYFLNGLAVDGGAFIAAETQLLQNLGVSFHPVSDSGAFSYEPALKNRARIYCTGFDESGWKRIRPLLHPVKGQLDVYASSLHLNHPVTSEGYVWSRDGYLFAGSSYEHTFSTTFPTPEGSRIIKEKASQMLKIPVFDQKPLQSWTGIRISSPDRRPVCGKIPGTENEWVLTGLGSKGLYYAKFLAEQLTNAILTNENVPAEFSIERFYR